MKKLLAILLCFSLILPAGIMAQADGTTVYVDPTGATTGAYSTLQEAANALPSGGTIVIKTDANTNAANTGTTVTASGKIRVVGETSSVRLSVTRALQIDCPELEIDNLTLVNSSSSSYDFIYARGHNLTIGSGVTTIKSSANRFLSVFAGYPSAACVSSGTITINAGSWNHISGGNGSGAGKKTFSGSLTYNLNGITANKLYVSGYAGASTATVTVNITNSTIAETTKTYSSGTYSGTYDITLKSGSVGTITNVTPDIDLSDGGTLALSADVTADTLTGGGNLTLTGGAVLTANTFTGHVNLSVDSPVADTAYIIVNDASASGTASLVGSEMEIQKTVEGGKTKFIVAEAPATPSTVYLDPAGTSSHDSDVYTTLGAAVAALPDTGGTIVVCSDTNVNVDSSTHFHMAAKPIRITGETSSVRLTQLRSWFINDALTIDNITWVNSSNASFAFIYCQAHNLTVGENVTSIPNGSTYLCILGGSAGVTNGVGDITGGDMTITVNSGTFRRIFGGGLSRSYSGNVDIIINGGTISDVYLAGSNAAGTVTGTGSITVNGGTITTAAKDSASGVFTGTSVVTFRAGSIGTVTDLTPSIDLSGGGSLSLGSSVTCGSITGGGTLELGRTAAITADSMTGSITLSVPNYDEGTAYLTINDENTAGTVTYIPVGSETMSRTVTGGTVQYSISAPRTHVRLIGYNPDGPLATQPNIRLYKGYSSDEDSVQITDVTTGTIDGYKKYIEADLTPGLYDLLINYASPYSHMRQYFYISGNETETVELERTFLPYTANNYEEQNVAFPTPEVTENFWNFANTNVEDFDLVTPTFTMEKYTRNNRAFMNNDDMCDFVDSLSSPYLHVYYPFELTELGNRAPVLVFTKDEVSSGISLTDLANEVVNGGTREILMIAGNQHGNEPSGTDGSLQLAYDLCGEYGEDILDSYGAIVIIPSVSLDNNQRFTREYPDGLNSNRDLLYQSKEGSRYISYIYNKFMPTVFISAHEDNEQNVVDTTDNSIADMRAMSYACSNAPNSPIVDVEGMVDGSVNVLETDKVIMMNSLITKAQQQGFRCMHYYAPSYYPVSEMAYSGIRGSYGFLLENQRMWSGKNNYEYTVKQMTTGLKNIIEEVVSVDESSAKTLAQRVAEGRENARVSEYDPDRKFILKLGSSVGGTDPNPSVYVDGTWKDMTATKNWSFHTTVTAYRTLPASYVIPADLKHIDDILDVLEAHGISYARIENGATRTLKRYSVSLEGDNALKASATIGENAAVTFENGAYEVSLNTSDAYLIAYLFEPDSSSGYYASFVNMGYISTTDALYRNETTVIADGDIEEDVKFAGASLTLESDLKLQFGFEKPVADSGYYSDIRTEFVMNGETIDSGEYTESGDYYVFALSNVSPEKMTDTITAKLYVTQEGVEYLGDTKTYSVGQYLYSLLDEAGDDEELKTLVVDLLGYGDASQIYKRYKTGWLVGDLLTAEQRSWGTAGDPVLTSVTNTKYETVESPEAIFKGAFLSLSDLVEMVFIFTVADTEGVSVRIKDSGGTTIGNITADKLQADGGRYNARFKKLNATQMSDIVYVTVYRGDTPISNTLTYSIESYACAKQDSTYPYLAQLVKAMMKYGNSARAYAE